MTRFLLFFISLFFSFSIQAADIFVDQSAPSGGDGSTWALAFQTIEEAVAVAVSGDTIFIAEGIYKPENEMDISIPLDIRGGYPQGGGIQNINVNVTQIQADFDPGNLLLRIFDIGTSADCSIEGLRFYNVRYGIETRSSLILEQVEFEQFSNFGIRVAGAISSCFINDSKFSDFTGTAFSHSGAITNLNISNTIFQKGTGRILSLDNEVSNFSFTNIIVRDFNTSNRIMNFRDVPNPGTISNFKAYDNTLTSSGSILLIDNSNVTLSNAEFQNNNGQNGTPCIQTSDATVSIDNSIFSGNSVIGNGPKSVFLIWDTVFTVTNSRFENNHAQGTFSALADIRADTTDAQTTFDNCIFKENSTLGSSQQGIIDASYDTNILINNCVFDANSSPGEFVVDSFAASGVVVTNSTFMNHNVGPGVLSIDNVEGGVGGGTRIEGNTFINNSNTTVSLTRMTDFHSENNEYYGTTFINVGRTGTGTMTNEYFEGNNSGSRFMLIDEVDLTMTNTAMISRMQNGNHRLIDSSGDTSLNIINSTFSATDFNNTNVSVGFNADLASTLRNSIIWSGSDLSQSGFHGNTSNLQVRNSLVKSENPAGAGNLNGNQAANAPVFLNPENADFREQRCSPTVNAGNNSYTSETTDLNEDARVFQTTIDMGAYEIQTNQNASCTSPTLPACVALTLPTNGQNNVAVDTNLNWPNAARADGYRISAGTTPGGNDIIDNITVFTSFYNPPFDFEEGETIYVTLTSFNETGEVACTEESFTIITNTTTSNPPSCSALTDPFDGETDVEIDTDISWNSVSGADGYLVTVGSTSGGNDIRNAFDVGDVTTYDLPLDLPENSEIFVTIVAYNSAGNATGCTERSFFTAVTPSTNAFVTTWKTDNPGITDDNSIRIPTQSLLTYNYTVDWGDGNITTETGGATHTYATPGIYEVAINGTFPAIEFNFGGDKNKLLSIEQWGDIEWETMDDAFNGCNNMVGNFTDIPDLSRVTDMSQMFYACHSFNTNINDWNVSTVTSMNQMFRGARIFNQPLNNWDVSNVTEMSQMFMLTLEFNQSLNDWDVSNVTEMSQMFNRASAFNQPLNLWDVSNVTNMFSMFNRADAFNQDISGWVTTSCINMVTMFKDANSFDQNLSNWNVENLLFADEMFDGIALSLANYDALLIGWNSQNLQPNVSFSGGDSQYCDGAAARANMIASATWTITDGGTASPTINDLADQTQANSYTLPVITGTQLTGNEAYFTGPDGTGTQYNAGDTINFADFPSYPTTLYIYDGSGSCSSEETFELTITTSATSGAFITTWETTVANETITIPTRLGNTYDYTVDWGDGTTDTNLTGDITHTYTVPGIQTISITGTFPRIHFNGTAVDRDKILTIEQWGDIEWQALTQAFKGCSRLNITNPAIDTPNLSNVTNISEAFADCTDFNGDITLWNVVTVTNMVNLFQRASNFNQDIGDWNVSNVIAMDRVFEGATAFNQDIGDWDVSSVTRMPSMFSGADNFNQDIGNWNVSNVTDMNTMFAFATSFNQDIGNWNVSNVTNIDQMFLGAAAFNQDISFKAGMGIPSGDAWNISNITSMVVMFSGASSFNQDISNWDVSNVTNMSQTFRDATSFDQDLSSWNVSNVNNAGNMFAGVTLSTANYDALLIGWNSQNLQPNVTFNGGNSQYCEGATARANMIASDTWTITDGGTASPTVNDLTDQTQANSYTLPVITGTQLTGSEAYFTGPDGTGTQYNAGDTINFTDFPSYPTTLYIYDGSGSCSSEENFELTITTSATSGAFITTWETTVANETITIPTFAGETYDYTVDWGDGTIDNNITGDATHTYTIPGIHTVSISGTFPRIFFDNSGDREKIFTIEQWGDIEWTSMELAFTGCTNLTGNFSDAPNLSNVTNMASMFRICTNYNSEMSNWDTSNVVNMARVLERASSFNQNITNWNTSSVLNMSGMFRRASNFNQDISFKAGAGFPTGDAWNVSQVTDMQGMFDGASVFNQNIGNWNVQSVTTMSSMLRQATAFNQDIGGWNVANVTNLGELFRGASSFNQDISGWDVSQNRFFHTTFDGATAFNQDISSWNTSSAILMRGMFKDASNFNQNIGGWDVSLVDNMEDMFDGVTLSTANYDALLIGWNSQNLQPNVTFNGGNSQYCEGATARANMIASDTWTITDGGTASPTINDLTDQNQANSYTLPAITGTQLTGNEAYFTGPDGTGTQYNAGDTINFADFPNYPVTLYIYDGAGSCASEESFLLTITNTATTPACTSLVVPANEDTDVSVATDITWNAVSGAEGYRLTIGTTAGGNDILDNEDVGNLLTYNPPNDLPSNTEIFVTIVPYIGAENATGCAEESFTTTGGTLACTTLIYPLNGATEVSLDPFVEWNDVADADGYTISIGTTPGGNEFSGPFNAINRTDYFATGYFAPNTTYYVSIEPYNASETATNCTISSFTTVSSTAVPPCIIFASPNSSQLPTALDANISWTNTPLATGYFLSLGTSSGATDILNNFDVGNSTSYDPPVDFLPNTTYYYTVTPYNSTGTTSSTTPNCREYSFTTMGIPSCTSITVPMNNSTGVATDTDLMWSGVSEADGYLLTVGTTSGGTDILNGFDVGNNTTYNLPADLPENTEIFVTVIPYNTSGNATGCAEERFTTIDSSNPTPSCTSLVVPANEDTDVSVATDITWNAVSGAEGYRLTIGTTAGGNDILDNEDVGNLLTYNPPNDLPSNTEIFVTIVPYIGAENATGCAEESFTTEVAQPGCANLITPTFDATDVPVDTNLTWNTATNAVRYSVAIGTATGLDDILATTDVGNNTVFDPPVDLPANTRVFVTITSFNAADESVTCGDDQFTTGDRTAVLPDCTALSSPLNGAMNVSADTDISWNAVANADGYRLTVGSSSGGNDIIDNFDAGDTVTFDFSGPFTDGITVFITITPYNMDGDAINCAEESFTIASPMADVLSCTVLTTPLNGATDVTIDTNIAWNEVLNANGYRLTIGTTAGGNDILDNEDVGILTSYQLPNNLPFEQQIFVTIIPYNADGDAENCEEQSFTTIAEVSPEIESLNGISPDGDGINEFWRIEGIEEYPNNTVVIYNRWGDMVYKVEGYDNTTNVFNGEANQLNGLGASQLPEGTYFFNIIIPESNNNLKQTKGYLVLKR